MNESIRKKLHENEILMKDIKFWKDTGVEGIERLLPSLMTDEQLSDLPPTLIFGGGKEIFIDDIKHFSERLISAQEEIYSYEDEGCQGNSEVHFKVDRSFIGGSVDNDSSKSDESDSNNYDIDDNGNFNLNNKNMKAKKKDEDSIQNSNGDSKNNGDNKNNNKNSRIRSRLIIAENDVHVYPILWRHPVHRVMEPIGLNWLFGLFFPGRKEVCEADILRNSGKNTGDYGGSNGSNGGDGGDGGDGRESKCNSGGDDVCEDDNCNNPTWKVNIDYDDSTDDKNGSNGSNGGNCQNADENDILLKKRKIFTVPKARNGQHVHSHAASDAIHEIAQFILKIRENREAVDV